MNQIVIGLSGHIDHGKTAVVHALTGVNTDRLEEEIRRGMTIDIGFAFLSDEITLIDVPGHEKFVKNMMAGASAVDAALLVIAADDGVMPQTREHFDILKLLDVKVGCIALNKIDLVDDDWIDLVELDIQEMVSNTFLENAPIVRVSAVQNNGIEELRATILKMCENIPKKMDREIFRLPIDRIFTKKGFGTVITGTVTSGSAKIGDTVELLPSGMKLKIRGLQSHTQKVDKIALGDRGAVNLATVDTDEIERGFQISAQGYFQSTNQIGVDIHLLKTVKKPVAQNQRIRVHLGTEQVMARVSIINDKLIKPGEQKPAILKLEKPLPASIGDKFIIRTYSPILTIGGGVVLDNKPPEKWKFASQKVKDLFDSNLTKRFELIVSYESVNPLNEKRLKLKLGISSRKIQQLVDENKNLKWISSKSEKLLVSTSQLDEIQQTIINFLEKSHKKNKYRSGVLKKEIFQLLNGDERFIEFILKMMEQDGILKQKDEHLSLSSHSIQLSDDEEKTLQRIIEILDNEGFASSNLTDLSKKVKKSEKEAKQLLKIASEMDKIITLDGSLIFTNNNFTRLKNKVVEHFSDNDTISVPQFKDLAKTTRKYAVPLLEYFDKLKITYRVGNERKLVAR
ncbi:MAG: selenocysteine-specific translation elongation factor [Candidatus Marinimicrobia bacterium]|nr:selenocysteine-specific translation elongation factor [Candidatus Neomarinimicrobiota bacterium]MBL7023261.1 selenocysteine-specific translation elongation factor [Candidatus Neomarinimicrobiota bacterium]MBL7108855.1 selenocysteine-specific translation elongation factor [Candidatus Neomarinimicrobiota bacterium]